MENYINEEHKNRVAIVYKTTNLLNRKFYVGFHMLQNNRKDKTYLGSGKALKEAIKLYGSENFKREIIHTGTVSECLELEEFIVDQEFIERKDTYNIKIGGIYSDLNKESRARQAESRRIAYQKLSEEEKEKIRVHLKNCKPEYTQEELSEIYRKRELKIKANPVLIKKRKEHIEKIQVLALESKKVGKWYTPVGVFDFVLQAAKANNVSPETIKLYCLNPDKKNCSRIMKGKGKTYRDCGFWFEPK